MAKSACVAAERAATVGVQPDAINQIPRPIAAKSLILIYALRPCDPVRARAATPIRPPPVMTHLSSNAILSEMFYGAACTAHSGMAHEPQDASPRESTTKAGLRASSRTSAPRFPLAGSASI